MEIEFAPPDKSFHLANVRTLRAPQQFAIDSIDKVYIFTLALNVILSIYLEVRKSWTWKWVKIWTLV